MVRVLVPFYSLLGLLSQRKLEKRSRDCIFREEVCRLMDICVVKGPVVLLFLFISPFDRCLWLLLLLLGW